MSSDVTESEAAWSETAHSGEALISRAAGVVEELDQRLVEIRRELHQNPELSFEEEETTRRLVGWLQEAGLGPQALPETTGLYVDIGPEDAEFAAGFRGDIDALPLDEVTELPYARRTPAWPTPAAMTSTLRS